MANVLCELFNMGGGGGDSDGIPKKKSLRKQPNPKFFHNTSTSTSTSTAAAADWDSSLRKDESASDNDINLVAFEEEEEEEDEEEKIKAKKEKEELFGFSRSEVTVIDTSFDVWKFDKLLFRKKNVWKVRDKKGTINAALRRKKIKTKESVPNKFITSLDVAINKRPKVSLPN
ncbi:hypothetical protein ACFE04_028844 [Oxalis oulophora]